MIECDVAIVGAGLAGMRAGVAIAEKSRKMSVAIISKTYALRSHSVCAEGGSAAVLREGDSFELHE
ncbi:MAG: FAD-binding protein, partial [Archaeoglobaceae archaeon]|nr:FAD-binding protein [Archaeoglobaceae archaeon]